MVISNVATLHLAGLIFLNIVGGAVASWFRVLVSGLRSLGWSPDPTSFPGSLILPLSASERGGKMRNPGNEVGPDQGLCVMFLSKRLYSDSASLHPVV